MAKFFTFGSSLPWCRHEAWKKILQIGKRRDNCSFCHLSAAQRIHTIKGYTANPCRDNKHVLNNDSNQHSAASFRRCGTVRQLVSARTYVNQAGRGRSHSNPKLRVNSVQQSCLFYHSTTRRNASNDDKSQGSCSETRLRDGIPEDADRTRDDGKGGHDRRAGIRTLLDDATTGRPASDEFDFDAAGSEPRGSESRGHSGRPRHDPSESSVFLFPGQGAQFVGMGQSLLKYPNVEDMFAIASEILGYDLLALCINGPAEELDRTIHCQPAVFVTSLAAVEKLKEEQPKALENCVAAAGFSVGEFAALVFGGSISFEDAIYLIKVRAEAMQRASEMESSGMISVIGSRRARYRSVCKEAETYCSNHTTIERPVCRVANYLFPDARVLAGHTEALSFIQEMSKSFNLRMVKTIPVSGAFHTPLMSSAQEPIAKALDSVAIETPIIQVHSNVDGNAYDSPTHIRKRLRKQIVEPVLWEQTMHSIYQREKGTSFPFTYEVGPGKQLGAMLQRNNLKAARTYAKVEV